MHKNLEHAQALAWIHALLGYEFADRGRLCPIMVEKANQVRALLISHLQSHPAENLEQWVQLVWSVLPLDKLVSGVRSHFPELDLSHILDN